ncbi:histidine-type phosphatase [Streptomyces noursei]|uniref:histidine-type phosphatase n=1 Tax=Streptomyces noursei TaxID=1971 RepID=UPI00234A17FD|nr:histidine-type phosphatase [Streptomyces noursei]
MFTENASRHGSRAAGDNDDGDLLLTLWDRAREEGQLTRLGEDFGPDVRALLAAMGKVGYGNLSGRGKQELHDTAERMAQRLPQLLDTIAKHGESTDVVSSGQGRAVDTRAPAPEPTVGKSD